MTDQPQDPTPPTGEPMADEPLPEVSPEAAESEESTKAREWLTQLESMIQDIATQAAPVARQVGAKAAELAAIAAVKAGPFAQKAADVTQDVGQRFAERAQSVAAELRAADSSEEGNAPDADETPTADDDTIAQPTLGDEPAEGPRT